MIHYLIIKILNCFPTAKISCHEPKKKKKVFFVNNAKTERYRKSSIPYMQRLLNKEDRAFQCFESSCNVKYYASELCHPGSITNDNLH